MRRSFFVAIATAFCCVAILCSTRVVPAQSQPAALTPSSAAQLLTHGGGVWVLESVGGQRIESACVGKFTLQFKPDHQAESVGCFEGGKYSSSSEWKLAATSDHKIALNLGNETTDLDLIEHSNGSKTIYFLRLKLLSVLDPKSGQLLIHEYRFKESASN